LKGETVRELEKVKIYKIHFFFKFLLCGNSRKEQNYLTTGRDKERKKERKEKSNDGNVI